MANAKSNKIIRIYGVTLPERGRATPYGNGVENIDGQMVAYVDYFIKDLILCIQKKQLEKEIINKLTKLNEITSTQKTRT